LRGVERRAAIGIQADQRHRRLEVDGFPSLVTEACGKSRFATSSATATGRDTTRRRPHTAAAVTVRGAGWTGSGAKAEPTAEAAVAVSLLGRSTTRPGSPRALVRSEGGGSPAARATKDAGRLLRCAWCRESEIGQVCTPGWHSDPRFASRAVVGSRTPPCSSEDAAVSYLPFAPAPTVCRRCSKRPFPHAEPKPRGAL
jgi:hypothetical protein